MCARLRHCVGELQEARNGNLTSIAWFAAWRRYSFLEESWSTFHHCASKLALLPSLIESNIEEA